MPPGRSDASAYVSAHHATGRLAISSCVLNDSPLRVGIYHYGIVSDAESRSVIHFFGPLAILVCQTRARQHLERLCFALQADVQEIAASEFYNSTKNGPLLRVYAEGLLSPEEVCDCRDVLKCIM